MLSKRPRPYSDDVPAPKRLAANVRNLYASNVVSANRTQMLVNDMASASVRYLPIPPQPLGNNTAGQVRSRMGRYSKWPKNYVADVRVRNRFKEVEELQPVCIQLISEVVDVLFKYGDRAKLLQTTRMDPESLDRLQAIIAKEGATMMGIGLHCDGIPHSWDREESCEVFTVNLPGLPAPWNNLRIPIFSIPHSAFSENTWDDLMEIIAWDLRHLFNGKRAKQRHDGTPFNATDSLREKRKDESMPCRVCVCEIRGDWKMLAETFHLPRWSEKKRGVCWTCECKLSEVALQRASTCFCEARPHTRATAFWPSSP